MEKFYRYDAIFIGMEKVADDIKHCIYGLNRLIEDEYHENVFKHHDRKWGNIKLDFENTKNKEFQKCLLTRNKVITANDEIQERKEFSLLSYKESMLRKQDLNYIFKIMERKSLSWWN
ncbi:MAG: hypothetical protein GQ540_03800 [Lutibacter sp.]|uniref:hypothetical protein n=1 Tax=Lutibacter sp. TaxID=1925666 RepID=UPI001A082F52|nr:hypothetical protein [Lutibacter sp.]NOR27637.1 hypothetical protein [Lutibacter sp.]